MLRDIFCTKPDQLRKVIVYLFYKKIVFTVFLPIFKGVS